MKLEVAVTDEGLVIIPLKTIDMLTLPGNVDEKIPVI